MISMLSLLTMSVYYIIIREIILKHYYQQVIEERSTHSVFLPSTHSSEKLVSALSGTRTRVSLITSWVC